MSWCRPSQIGNVLAYWTWGSGSNHRTKYEQIFLWQLRIKKNVPWTVSQKSAGPAIHV